jgi:FkbM family methyltransferase
MLLIRKKINSMTSLVKLMIKKLLLKTYFFMVSIYRTFLCRPITQKFFKRLYILSLLGMNFIGGDFVKNSGEINSFKYLSNMKYFKPVIFDVGANIGDYAKEAKSFFNNNLEIYCFEPSITTCELLQKNITGDNVHIYNFGFGDKSESVELYYNALGSGQASIFPKRKKFWTDDENKRASSIRIQLYRLTDFCKTNNINHINLLKLDVEGNELPILMGALDLLNSNSIDLIQFEFGTCNIFSNTFFYDFYELLSPNYKLFRILYNGIYPVDKYTQLDEIFMSANYLAVNKSISNS